MDQEAPDKLIGFEGHGLMSVSLIAAIVFPLEGDALFVEAKQPAVGDGHPVGVSRQISQLSSDIGK